jgi:hypothetical protein
LKSALKVATQTKSEEYKVKKLGGLVDIGHGEEGLESHLVLVEVFFHRTYLPIYF